MKRSARGMERTFGGVALASVLPALRALDPTARACWAYDLDALDQRVRTIRAAFRELDPLIAYALKANSLPALLASLHGGGLAAECGSLGELELAKHAGYTAAARVLNGNGRTPEEAEWATREGVALVNADHVAELDELERASARTSRRLRVALRVNPGIDTEGHRYVATGGEGAKFGMAASEALEAWSARSRWPHLTLDGVHVHIGSQLVDTAPLERALETVFELVDESARRGAPLALVNLGGGLGVDYGGGAEFPLERWARHVTERSHGRKLDWVIEPGRWLVAGAGVLLAEVLWVKQRGGRRFVVLAAGMNDLLRPALYSARHRIVPVSPREGDVQSVTIVGPVCESADVFATQVELSDVERGDVLALLDAGAYGASMSSNYNGRGRLAEVVASSGTLRRARAAENAVDLARLAVEDVLELPDGTREIRS